MHRSGTSVLASALQKAGVDIGSSLLEPDSRNPRGFFEDIDFYQFHERALIDRGTTTFVNAGFEFRPTSEEREQALALLRQREGKALWGWKDPRTALFLDFWWELVPEARFLFVYRHPLEVLASFIRRREAHIPGLLEGVAAWTIYNSTILAFHERHRGVSTLAHTYGALRHPEDLGRLLAARGIEVDFGNSTLDELFHPDELRRLPITAGLTTLLRKIQPEAIGVYEALQAAADLPDLTPARGPAPDLGGVEAAVSALAEPPDSARVRGLLWLLLASLDPQMVEGYFNEHGRLGFEGLRARLHAALGEQEANPRRRDEAIPRLDENSGAKVDGIETQAATIKRLEAVVEEQRATMADLEVSRARLARDLERIHHSHSWRAVRWLAESFPARVMRWALGVPPYNAREP